MATAAEQVSAARAEIENLSADTVAAEIEKGAVLVDLREADEVAAGMIPSAIHIPRGMLEFRADPTSPYHDDRLDPSKRVVVHCASGGRSALAAQRWPPRHSRTWATSPSPTSTAASTPGGAPAGRRRRRSPTRSQAAAARAGRRTAQTTTARGTSLSD